jgi:hypothetical protein
MKYAVEFAEGGLGMREGWLNPPRSIVLCWTIRQWRCHAAIRI